MATGTYEGSGYGTFRANGGARIVQYSVVGSPKKLTTAQVNRVGIAAAQGRANAAYGGLATGLFFAPAGVAYYGVKRAQTNAMVRGTVGSSASVYKTTYKTNRSGRVVSSRTRRIAGARNRRYERDARGRFK